MTGRWRMPDEAEEPGAGPSKDPPRSPRSRHHPVPDNAEMAQHSPILAAPGVLRSESYLTVQTRQAQRLILGRRFEDGTPGILGMMRFATLLRPIWSGARADDPFADWWLVRIHDAVEESERELLALKQHVELVLKRMPAMTVTVAQSVEPLRVPLTFSNPYAFRGAYLLAHYDEVVRGVLTARHVALLERDSTVTLLGEAARHARRAYLSALGYQFLGITRDDLRLMTARGVQAQAKMGAVPKDVVDGRLKAPYAPDPAPARLFTLRGAEPGIGEDDGLAATIVTEPEVAPGDGASAGVPA